MTDRKPLLCLDFDGVLHSYTSPWVDSATILDPPVPGALAFLSKATMHFRVMIHSSRSIDLAGRIAMDSWLRLLLVERYDETEAYRIIDAHEFPAFKPPAFLTIDDRALTFTGTWPDVEGLLAFKPWNKRVPA